MSQNVKFKIVFYNLIEKSKSLFYELDFQNTFGVINSIKDLSVIFSMVI